MIKQFEKGSYKKGDVVSSGDDIWEAQKDIKKASANPRNGQYWKKQKCATIKSLIIS